MKPVHGLVPLAILCASLDMAGATSAPWVEVSQLTAADAEAGDEFGRFVAVAGDVAMVGAHLDDHSGLVDAGSVYVFLRQADGSWQENQRLVAGDATARDYFGVRGRPEYREVGGGRDRSTGPESLRRRGTCGHGERRQERRIDSLLRYSLTPTR